MRPRTAARRARVEASGRGVLRLLAKVHHGGEPNIPVRTLRTRNEKLKLLVDRRQERVLAPRREEIEDQRFDGYTTCLEDVDVERGDGGEGLQ